MTKLDPKTGTETAGEERLLDALRRGDERAFCTLLDRYGPSMLRFALLYTTDRALAEDAVQDAWVAVLQGVERFEGRCALRTWLFRILLNRLRSRIRSASRLLPFSALTTGADAPAVAPEMFHDAQHPRWSHHWKTPPRDWGPTPEARLLASEARARVDAAVAALPPQQRTVISLRDIDGWSAEDVCHLLGISESNQRVLLHRARARVRRALADYFAEG